MTSAIINVDGSNQSIYKHCDGYPSNLLPWLKQFNERFAKERGNDPEYKLASLLIHATKEGLNEESPYAMDINDRFTGWGIYGKNEMETDHIYTLHADGTVTHEKAGEAPKGKIVDDFLIDPLQGSI